MSLTTAEIRMVAARLSPLVGGGKIVRIDQPERHCVVLQIRNRTGRYWLQIDAHPEFSRLHLLTSRPAAGAPAGGFCNVLRQNLTGSPVKKLTWAEGDRVVVLHCTKRDALLKEQPLRLIAELTGGGSNIVLVDTADTILGCLFSRDSDRRRLMPGRRYETPPPPPAHERAEENRFASEDDPDDVLSLSRAIIDHYGRAEERSEFLKHYRELEKRIRQRRVKLRRLSGKIGSDLQTAANAEDVRREGELLKIALPDMVKGQKSVTVRDFFREGAPERCIELDPHLSPQENIQRFFRRYKRLKNSIMPLRKRLDRIERESNELEMISDSLDNTKSFKELKKIEDSVEVKDLLREAGPEPNGPQRDEAGGPRRFLSENGFEILVARNRQQNHQLTFSIARGNDCWMHVMGHPGAHVIIRRPKGREIPEETLLEGAQLAIHYSKMRGAGFVRVIHTLRKYVQPVRGAEAGTVHYSGESSIGVRYSKKRLSAVLERRRERQ